MKKRTVFAALLFLLATTISRTQGIQPTDTEQGFSNLGSIAILLPTGEFAGTHTIGAGLNYTWSRSHFGYFQREKLKRIGLIVSTGMGYYIGKKNLTTAGHPFSFGNYFNFHLMPGAMYNFHKKASLSLAAGPTIALHDHSTSFAFGSNLNIDYYVQPKVSIGMGSLYMKHEYVKSLWSLSIRSSYTF